MTRTLKTLSLALFAVCTVGAVGASSALAARDIVTCTNTANCDITAAKKSGTTTILGTKTSLLEAECTEEKFSVTTVANGAENVTATPLYNGCLAEPFGPATIDMNGCDYLLTGATTTSTNTSGANRTTAAVDIEGTCTSIVITAPDCEIRITKQSLKHGLIFSNEGPLGTTEDVKVTAHIDNIHYTTNDTIACTVAGLGPTGNDAFITGTFTAKGYESHTAHGTANHVGFAVDTV
jgi:hypothetical protein